jgi:rod shape-determining protein MreC
MLQIGGWSLRAPSYVTRFVLLGILAVALMWLDARGQHLQRIRTGLTVLITPIQMLAQVPIRAGGWVAEQFRGDETLHRELDLYRREQPLLLARLEKYQALEAENAHLRTLLGTSALVADKAVAAELVEVANEPFRRTIVIAKGGSDGLYLGQPVIDAFGIRGQVSEVGALRSRAILITDPGHAIPVQVKRNGLRAVAFGTGAADKVSIRYLTASADIKEGDLLVSSGLGGSFPFGYPVAKVSKIVNNPSESFLDIEAAPVAQIGHHKEVLLIWPSKEVRPPEAKKPPEPRKPVAAGKPPSPKPAAPPKPAPPAVVTPPVSPVAPAPAETVPAATPAPAASGSP